MNGVAMMVAMRSRRFGITLVAMIDGTAQANPEISGTTDCPESPTARMARSMRNAVRARYPVSSMRMMNRKRMSIWGRKITTLPTPAITPSARKLANAPAGSVSCTQPPIPPAAASIRSIMGVAQANTAWNTVAISSRKRAVAG